MRKIFFLVYLCAFTTVLSGMSAVADEGMWPFNHLPKDALQSRYGFVPTPDWLEHVMKASVRFDNGGSGSFISSDGLVLTNHHVAGDILEQVSTPDHDYFKNGFYARNQSDEIRAPDLSISQLISIEDVTAKVNSAVKDGMGPAEAYQARQAMMGEIAKESEKQTGLKSEVVTLYSGAQYELYRYKRYTDIRIVFAPELGIAFFGGDPDNFEYPRFDLDMSIVRVYEDGKPAKIDHYFHWSSAPIKENDLVFVSGNPGKTERLNTVAALEFLRDVRLPARLGYLKHRESSLMDYSARSEESARQAKGELFYIQNSRKVYVGRVAGLNDPTILSDKQKSETELRQKVESTPELKKYAGAWDEIARAQQNFKGIFNDYMYFEQAWGFSSSIFSHARSLVRLAAEKQKPSSERLPEFQEAALASLEQSLFSDAPMYAAFEQFKLADALEYMQAKLGNDHFLVKKVLNGKSASDRAAELIRNTVLFDSKNRKEIAIGGQQAIDQSQDSMIQLAVLVDPYSRQIRKNYEDNVVGLETDAYPQISQALFAIYGMGRYPDATFTPRLSFGLIKGYEQDGLDVGPWTTLGGAFLDESTHQNKDPWLLPDSWHTSKSSLDLNIPFNFVSTADIIGGNSGSPVINRDGDLVGLIFDGNIQSLVADYVYSDTQNRAVSVASQAMLEALRKIYGAGELADHLGK